MSDAIVITSVSVVDHQAYAKRITSNLREYLGARASRPAALSTSNGPLTLLTEAVDAAVGDSAVGACSSTTRAEPSASTANSAALSWPALGVVVQRPGGPLYDWAHDDDWRLP